MQNKNSTGVSQPSGSAQTSEASRDSGVPQPAINEGSRTLLMDATIGRSQRVAHGFPLAPQWRGRPSRPVNLSIDAWRKCPKALRALSLQEVTMAVESFLTGPRDVLPCLAASPALITTYPYHVARQLDSDALRAWARFRAALVGRPWRR